ncbi:MAG: glucokinase, partial [Planctomycetota bacterium]|nr:glucokinase [Planctomycetota bacterium]
GNGIQHIHDFFRKRTQTVTPDWLQSELSVGDPNAILTQVGMEGKDALCQESIELYCTLLGAEAGNLALTSLSRGGVFLGGGIPPKILAALKKPHFLEGFLEKGDLSDLMKSIPVRVALNPRAALIGAAHYLVS